MKTNLSVSYPGITQSIIITGIVIAATLLFTPVPLVLDNLVSKEASAFVYYLCMMGSSYLVVFFIRKKKIKTVKFNFGIENPRIVPVLIIGSIALAYGVILPLTEIIPVPERMKSEVASLLDHQGMFTFTMVVIAAPVLEELIFRGIMLDGLLKQHRAGKAILVSSILFGIVHLNPWQFVAGFILSVCIGWVYTKTGSVSFSIIMHSAVNLSGYLLRLFHDSNSLADDSLIELYGGNIYFIWIVSSAIAVLALCVFLFTKEINTEKRQKIEVIQ